MCPRIDEQNRWNTIVFNPKTEELIRINRSGYFILKLIEETPGIEREELGDLKFYTFIEKMIKENVIIAKAV
jgi:hypothetical protein